MELSLHVGTKTLHGAKRTNWIVQDSYTITWNQELEFITKLKNIPKAAKLLVIVRQARNKDSDNKNRTFYWGLLRIFDHRYYNTCMHIRRLTRTLDNAHNIVVATH